MGAIEPRVERLDGAASMRDSLSRMVLAGACPAAGLIRSAMFDYTAPLIVFLFAALSLVLAAIHR
jgi:hypothetical protein